MDFVLDQMLGSTWIVLRMHFGTARQITRLFRFDGPNTRRLAHAPSPYTNYAPRVRDSLPWRYLKERQNILRDMNRDLKASIYGYLTKQRNELGDVWSKAYIILYSFREGSWSRHTWLVWLYRNSASLSRSTWIVLCVCAQKNEPSGPGAADSQMEGGQQ